MKKTIIQFLLLFIILVFLIYSCANTSTPPTGGSKDTIPPTLVKVIPDSNSINFLVKGGDIELKFNEYVILQDPVKYIYLSPPQIKKPVTKIRGKSIIVTFAEPLDSSITYSLHFGNSIADNNESNLLNPYVYSFSTGSAIDSMMCSGVLLDSRTLLPLEHIVIGFYSNISDTALYKKFPAAIAKSDKWGYFVVRNLKKIPYRVFAFKDGNGNNMYNPENEEVAFYDSLIVPSKVMKKDLPELLYVDMKDTSKALARPSQIDLYLFKEKSLKQYIKDKKRLEKKMAFITFAAPDVKIDSMGFRGIDSAKTIKQFNITKDSLVLWINDTLIKLPDTLVFDIKYYKTDSLNNLVLTQENFKMIAPKPKKIDIASKKNYGSSYEKPPRADLLNFKIEAEPSQIEQQGFKLLFPAPLVRIKLDSLMLISKTPKGVTKKESYLMQKDTMENRLYYVYPNIRLLEGYEYILKIPEGAFKDVYGYTNDSSATSIVLPNSEKLCKLTLNISGSDGSYVVELTNQTRDKVYRSFKIVKDTKLDFPYIQPGKYNIRVTQDLNGNGILDPGNISLKKQPEKVRLYLLPNGSTVIDFKEGIDLEQNINLKEIFK